MRTLPMKKQPKARRDPSARRESRGLGALHLEPSFDTRYQSAAEVGR